MQWYDQRNPLCRIQSRKMKTVRLKSYSQTSVPFENKPKRLFINPITTSHVKKGPISLPKIEPKCLKYPSNQQQWRSKSCGSHSGSGKWEKKAELGCRVTEPMHKMGLGVGQTDGPSFGTSGHDISINAPLGLSFLSLWQLRQ